jgi:hypothetical protein
VVLKDAFNRHNPAMPRRALTGARLAARPALLALALVAVWAAVDGSASVGARAPAAGQPAGLTRYSLVHGCYTLRARPGAAALAASDGPFRMQAAALDLYLLYAPGGSYLADAGGGSLRTVEEPTPAAEWRVDGTGARGFTTTPAWCRRTAAPRRSCFTASTRWAGS